MRRDAKMPFIKNLKKNVIQRNFFKPRSIFAKWQEDNHDIVQECLDHDMNFFKFAKFIKNQEEIDEVLQIIKKNFLSMKEIFTCIIADSDSYPKIG